MNQKPKDTRRIVVKLGSNLFFAPDGDLALGRIASLIEDIAEARLSGLQIITVSSGAVALGAAVFLVQLFPELDRLLRRFRRARELDGLRSILGFGEVGGEGRDEVRQIRHFLL